MKRLSQILTVMVTVFLFGTVSSYSKTYPTDSGVVFRVQDDGTRNKVCDIQYYVNGDTLFVNQQFKHLGFIFSDKRTGKMILKQEMVLFYNNHHGPWWYVIVNKNTVCKPNNSKLTAVVLRDCMLGVKPKSIHRCADAYLYNVSKEIPSWLGEKQLTDNLVKLIKNI